MNYGTPYKGSKSAIAEKIIDFLPAADTLYDLFAGGCAITHCAALSGKWNRIVFNDLDPLPTELFMNAVNGKYHNEARWISREMFEQLKDSDPYVRYCWSFGNNGRDYLYGKEIEPFKEALHNMIFAETPSERRQCWRPLFKSMQDITNNRILQELQSLESLESLERLQSLESLERHCEDYSEVEIAPNSVIYCDIPYKGTDKYQKSFDYERFYDWACRQEVPIFISEYQMPEDRFECMFETVKTVTMAARTTGKKVEKIFVPK